MRFRPGALRLPSLAALLISTLLALFAPAAPVYSAEPPAEPEAPAEDLQGTIGEIRVIAKSIFDPEKPGEDRWVFRVADRLHRTTRPEVIQRQILLQPGDTYSADAVEESERILRANRYLYEAEIRPVPRRRRHHRPGGAPRATSGPCGPGSSFNRAGGENSTDFTLQDSNFLGTGKDLTVWRISNVDRTSTLFRYRDPGVLGTRTQVEISAADYSDGGSKRLEIERPFYSLDTRWAVGFKTFVYDRVDSLYDRGEIFQKIAHDREQLEFYAGFSRGLSRGATHRWLVGFNRELDKFEYSPGGDSTPLPPDNRLLAYPWVGWEYVEDGFVTESQLDRIQGTEDLNLGTQLRTRLGWTSPAFGGDDDQLVASARATTGWRPGERQLLLTTLDGGSRWGDDGTENLLVGGNLRYYLRNFGRRLFYGAVEGAFARRLDPETQLLLGGDTGLRGYPLRFQSGDRRWLATLEQRFFSQREFFHVLHVGGAVFFDAGRAWFKDDPDSQKMLRDVGVGLRLGSSRSSSGTTVHLDVAFPLDADDTIKGVQYLVSTSESF